MPVVGDLQQLESAIFDSDLDRRRACIERILHQLLYGVGWTMNDLKTLVEAVAGGGR